MLPSNIELLRHILDEIAFVIENTSGKQEAVVTADPVLSRAIIRSLEIIGEASVKLSSEFKETHSEIEWKKITNTRNRLIHDYFGVDYEIIWDIVVTKTTNPT
jgi:uncharacterized protein with HEPN domain